MAFKELLICLVFSALALAQLEIDDQVVRTNPGNALQSIAPESKDQYFQEKNKRGVYWFKTWKHGKDCDFKGYAPNGPIASVSAIKAPKATLDAKKSLMGVMSGPLKKMGKVAAVTMHAIKFASKIGKLFPALGPALGVFSAVTGLIGGGPPSAQDILDKVNVAIQELTDEVNKKMKEMENYVDSAIAKTEKELIQAEYKSSFRLWASCIKSPTEDEGNRCQRDSARHIIARRPKFTPEDGKLGGAITMKQVRRLEAYMLAFRDYANLVVMQLTTLTNYYCLTRKTAAQAAFWCDRYAGELAAEATFLSNYAEQAIAAIKRGHWGGKDKMGPCNPGAQKCNCKPIKEGFWNTHTCNDCRCSCEILNANKKLYCQVHFFIRIDGKGAAWGGKEKTREVLRTGGNSNYWGATNEYGKGMLSNLAREYQNKNHAVMNKYWQQEVLDFVKEWRKAVDMAKEAKTKNPYTPNDAEAVLDEGFSSQYLTRLAATGYTYSDLQRFQDYQIGDIEESNHLDQTVEAEDPQIQFEDDSHLEEDNDEEQAQDEDNFAEFERLTPNEQSNFM